MVAGDQQRMTTLVLRQSRQKLNVVTGLQLNLVDPKEDRPVLAQPVEDGMVPVLPITSALKPSGTSIRSSKG